MPIGGFFKLFEFRGGLSKYHHAELDPEGNVGSRFFLNGGELRADLVQSERNGWGGTTGVQYLESDGAASAATRNTCPTTANENLGLFTLQSVESGKVRFEGAARVDFTRLAASADPVIADLVEEVGADSIVGTSAISRNFTAWSGSRRRQLRIRARLARWDFGVAQRARARRQ